ncbi:transcriptional regulator [Listeria seeligeri]|uniref:helix-turn-helix domain-containing protein n=1 Tax=Listeria seeligeri TaxID=1640 RepID=UPI0009532360|nr:helix-turn-helix transcriptional regulator [Listeria seeligeri]OLQ23992.1 transcriptional regulator [Listeria seeligeri]
MKPDVIEVGRRIKEIRTNLGYSMSQFGELISNSPKTTVNNWERGINLPKEDKLKKIALLGKTTTNELLYGSPEEFITKIVVDHFRLQLNPLFIQQIILFLNQQKIDLYDEMTIIEFIQGILNSDTFAEQKSTHLSYTPIIGSEDLYLALVNDKEIEKPVFYVYVEKQQNRVHLLPYTFAEQQEELYYEQPSLKTQLDIDYYTRQFFLLGITLKEAKIVCYGINKQKKKLNLLEYIFNDSTKIFDKNRQTDKKIIYDAFKEEAEKMLLWVKLGDK